VPRGRAQAANGWWIDGAGSIDGGGSSVLTTSYWPAEAGRPLDDVTVGDLLRRVAGEVPDRVALVDGQLAAADRRRWTYAELLAIADDVAAALLARFEPGERVAVWEANRPEWVMLQLGAALAGVILVTVNPQYRAAELDYVLRQSGVAGLVHGTSHRGVSMTDVVDQLRPGLPALREVICFADWAEFVAGDGAGRARPRPRLTSADPALIIYTSGTTGFAKGALLHHLGLVNAAGLSAERAGFQDGDAWINPIPLFHTGGGVLAGIGCLARRGTHVVVPQFDPALVLELIEAERGAMVLTVPTMLLAMLERYASAPRDLSSLRTVMSGGAKVADTLVRRTTQTFGCEFSILFGQAELHGVLTQTRTADSPKDQAETLGQPMPHVEVKIADLVTGEPVGTDEDGEICARGYQNMAGYYDMPDATAATIDGDGWLHTGDVGQMDARGYLRIAGRLRDIIIRGGENIHALEIEQLLAEHPQLLEVAVIGVPDPHWGEQVAAVIRPAQPDAPPDPDELTAFCQARLARFKTPRAWFFVDSFPMTPSGKIRKFDVEAWCSRRISPLMTSRVPLWNLTS
jgi:fatty-acyl-CoA synthase